mmetsp:Transcript_8177/g.34719  ORF Transcript_8177/g.34719 Transcript_8177/m.34719 type:complete len:213 (-) Transcript_8177:1014-1652(-)
MSSNRGEPGCPGAQQHQRATALRDPPFLPLPCSSPAESPSPRESLLSSGSPLPRRASFDAINERLSRRGERDDRPCSRARLVRSSALSMSPSPSTSRLSSLSADCRVSMPCTGLRKAPEAPPGDARKNSGVSSGESLSNACGDSNEPTGVAPASFAAPRGGGRGGLLVAANEGVWGYRSEDPFDAAPALCASPPRPPQPSSLPSSRADSFSI